MNRNIRSEFFFWLKYQTVAHVGVAGPEHGWFRKCLLIVVIVILILINLFGSLSGHQRSIHSEKKMKVFGFLE